MYRLALGLPTAPLPDRWWRGISRRNIHRIVSVELHGSPKILPRRSGKGYVWVYIGMAHPYAYANGNAMLHRWVACRSAGRRLAAYEHAHHANDDGDKTRVDDIQVLHAIDHGQYHYGEHYIRSTAGTLIWVGCNRKREMTEEELNDGE